eukprot:14982_1
MGVSSFSTESNEQHLIRTGSKADNVIIIDGYLEKKSIHLKQFRKRWIVLRNDNKIYSYKNSLNISNPTEIIDLHYCEDIIASQKNESNGFKLIFGKKERVFVAATNNDQITKWIRYIRKCLNNETKHQIHDNNINQITKEEITTKINDEYDVNNCNQMEENRNNNNNISNAYDEKIEYGNQCNNITKW